MLHVIKTRNKTGVNAILRYQRYHEKSDIKSINKNAMLLIYMNTNYIRGRVNLSFYVCKTDNKQFILKPT